MNNTQFLRTEERKAQVHQFLFTCTMDVMQVSKHFNWHHSVARTILKHLVADELLIVDLVDLRKGPLGKFYRSVGNIYVPKKLDLHIYDGTPAWRKQIIPGARVYAGTNSLLDTKPMDYFDWGKIKSRPVAIASSFSIV